MRLLFSLAFMLLFALPAALAQPSEKELAKHTKEVARSLRNQDAIISLDTLFNSGRPYAVVRRKNKHEPSYQLVSLQGEALFWVDQEINIPVMPGGPPTDSWRVYTFVTNGETETAALPLFTNLSERDMAREIIRHGLIDENGLVPGKVKVFVERYRKVLPEPEKAVLPAVLPARDRSKPVYRKNRNAISQDYVTIAMVYEKRERSTKEMRAQLYNADGRRYSVFMYMPGAHNTLEFETYTDNRKHLIQVGPEADPVLEVAAYLVAKGYL